MSVLCAANVPVGCAALGILLEEREKIDVLEAYRGDLLWSILGTLHGIAGADLHVPSYSEMLGLVDRKAHRQERSMTNDDVRKSVENTLRRFGAAK